MARLVPTNLSEFEAQLKAAIMEKIKAGVLHLNDVSKDTLQEMISIPVEQDGDRLIRSMKGEAPRMETGELHDNVGTDVEVEEWAVVGAITSERPSTPHVPALLDDPQGLDRPFMRTLTNWMEDNARDIIAEGMTK